MTDLVITPDEVPELIDELPVLAALGTFGGSVTVSGAGELRVKESDRIAELVAGLRAMGADADERPDGFQVRPARASPAAPCTRGTITAWRWRSRSRRSARRAPRTSTARTRSRCRIPRSSTISIGLRSDGAQATTARAREGRQDLSGRLHGRRQDHRGAGARQAPRLEGRGHRRAHRAGRAARHPDDLSRPTASPTSAPASARRCSPCCPSAARSSRRAAAPSWTPPTAS